MPIIGIVENLSGYVCPDCGNRVDIFKSGGGKKIAQEQSVPYLGSVPIDPKDCIDSDNGMAFIAENPNLPTAKAFTEIVPEDCYFLQNTDTHSQGDNELKVCLSSTANNLDAQLDPRFGRCPYLLIVDTETLQFEAIPNLAAGTLDGAGIQQRKQ